MFTIYLDRLANNTFKAFIKNQPGMWAGGRTGAEVIGNLVCTYQDLFQLKIDNQFFRSHSA